MMAAEKAEEVALAIAAEELKCRRYIGHLAKVIPTVIEREGRASGY